LSRPFSLTIGFTGWTSFFVGTEKLASNQVVLFKADRIDEATLLPALQQTKDYLASLRTMKQQLEQQQQAVSALPSISIQRGVTALGVLLQTG